MKLQNRALAKHLIDTISAISLPGGMGITRPSYSSCETSAMNVIADWAENAGLLVSWDFASNLHCTLPSSRGDKEIVMGSHVDSVPNGGRYDGVAGVVGAVTALDRIIRSGTHTRPLRLVVFRGEESAWFGKCYLGSSALFGELPASALSLMDPSRKLDLLEAVNMCGGDPLRIAQSERILDPRNISHFFELHIEQGPVLEKANEPIGIVSAIRGNVRFPHARIIGEAGHSGTTPVELRKDALFAFVEFMHDLEAKWDAHVRNSEDVVMTCGIAHTDPATQAMSVIPGEFRFGFECRSIEDRMLIGFEDHCKSSAKRIARTREVDIRLGQKLLTPPMRLDTDLANKVRAVASEHLNVATDKVRLMPSGAGHDSAVFQSQGIPTAMIFIRNQFGSHNPREAMEIDDLMTASSILERTILSLD